MNASRPSVIDPLAAATPPGWFSPALGPAWALALAACLVQFDVTAVAIVLPEFGREFGFGIAGQAWVMDAYSLAFSGLLLAAGALADRHGRRRALLAGNVLFALASLGCGLAETAPQLWAGRPAQGAAGAFVITGSLASLSLGYPEPLMRARAFSLLGVIAGAAMALGPTLGGALASWLGWRSIFLVSLPVCIVISLVVPRLVPETREPNGRPFDGTGLALFTGALLALVQALLHAEGGPLVRSALVILSAVLCLAFLRRQRRRARPMLDPSLIARREPLGLAGLLLALSVGYWAVLVYLPSYFSAAYGLGTTDAGLAMLAATVPMLVLPPAGARVARRWGWRRTFVSGLLILAIGTAALAAASHLELPLPAAIVAIVLATSGAGLINPQASGALIATAPPDQAGMASSVATILRQGGFAIGIALLGAVIRPGETGGSAFTPAFAVAALAATMGAVAILALRPPDQQSTGLHAQGHEHATKN